MGMSSLPNVKVEDAAPQFEARRDNRGPRREGREREQRAQA
jgi:hypothetical protein